MRIVLVAAAVILVLAVAGYLTFQIGISAPSIPVPPQADAVISGVTVLNPSVSRAENQTIVIRAGKMVEVRATQASDPASDCPGCIAMPGLIDAHVHTPPQLAFGSQELFSLMYLAYGVTSVRDVGQSEDSVAVLAGRLNRGELVGPYMYRCGPVLDGDPVSWGAARKVVIAAEATTAVNELAASKVDCIKIYNEIGMEAYQAIRASAARHGIPVIGHVPHKVGMRNVFDFESQHFTGMPYLRGGRPALTYDFNDQDFLTMTDADISAALDMARAHRFSYLPTLANGRLRLVASDPLRYPPTPGAAYLPLIWVNIWNSNAVAGHPTGPDVARRVARNPMTLKISKLARDRGIDVLAGTDTLMPWVVPGEALLLEIEELALAFGDNEAALAAATTVNGRHMASGEIGTISPGARADILLLPTDPTKDLAALRAWKTQFANGRRYEREVVDAWLDNYRKHFRSALYSFAMSLAADVAGANKGHANEHDGEGAVTPPLKPVIETGLPSLAAPAQHEAADDEGQR
ncbi:MAG: amidohydrolase family protein [Alphaproteobacteria bacterium]|nr:amidohydrolase family protein [Alphaproteobacteria bacterium]